MGKARLQYIATLDAPGSSGSSSPSLEWVTGGVMYQIQPRAFTPEGTLKAAQVRLPKLADLGADIIYLCPVFVSDDDPNTQGWSPRQKKSGVNNPRNPYRMKDYYEANSCPGPRLRFGLRGDSAQAGLLWKVILDTMATMYWQV